jgi:hypothetical protein
LVHVLEGEGKARLVGGPVFKPAQHGLDVDIRRPRQCPVQAFFLSSLASASSVSNARYSRSSAR